MEENDGLPSNVCTHCFLQISRFCSFKTKVERTDANLRKYLKEHQKQDQQNIITQAANDADIDISNDAVGVYKMEGNDDDDDYDDDDDDSEDDVQLSVRKTR